MILVAFCHSERGCHQRSEESGNISDSSLRWWHPRSE